ncbi:MAG: hypothetical protein P8079_08975 [Gammaproteobacteria bacterium]
MMGKRIFLLFAALLTVIPAAHAELKIGYVNAANSRNILLPIIFTNPDFIVLEYRTQGENCSA